MYKIIALIESNEDSAHSVEILDMIGRLGERPLGKCQLAVFRGHCYKLFFP